MRTNLSTHGTEKISIQRHKLDSGTFMLTIHAKDNKGGLVEHTFFSDERLEFDTK